MIMPSLCIPTRPIFVIAAEMQLLWLGDPFRGPPFSQLEHNQASFARPRLGTGFLAYASNPLICMF